MKKALLRTYYDDQGHYAYLMLADGASTDVSSVCSRLERGGIRVTATGRPRRAASDGMLYTWYLRVVLQTGGKPSLEQIEQALLGDARPRSAGKSRSCTGGSLRSRLSAAEARAAQYQRQARQAELAAQQLRKSRDLYRGMIDKLGGMSEDEVVAYGHKVALDDLERRALAADALREELKTLDGLLQRSDDQNRERAAWITLLHGCLRDTVVSAWPQADRGAMLSACMPVLFPNLEAVHTDWSQVAAAVSNIAELLELLARESIRAGSCTKRGRSWRGLRTSDNRVAALVRASFGRAEICISVPEDIERRRGLLREDS